MSISGPLKWHGGKSYLATRIVAMMPPHIHYVEPYFGGGAVLLAKNPEGTSEVANDLNGALIEFWKVLADPNSFIKFSRRMQATPFSESHWISAHDDNPIGSPVDAAGNFFILCRQSMSGRMKDFAPLSRTRVRRGMNEQASAWLNAVEGLAEVHKRLQRVVILNRDALEVIRQQDGEDTLFYLDPPYLHETRASPDEYAHEMKAIDHEHLLIAISHIKGKFLLSGYDSELYRRFEEKYGWNRAVFDLPNNSAGGDTKRRMTEIVWSNFECITDTVPKMLDRPKQPFNSQDSY